VGVSEKGAKRQPQDKHRFSVLSDQYNLGGEGFGTSRYINAIFFVRIPKTEAGYLGISQIEGNGDLVYT